MADAKGKWALILGASSGFGGTTARRLAEAGYDITGVHLDRKGTMPLVEEVRDAIRKTGRKERFFNINAADAEKRAEVVATLKEEGAEVAILFHSLAFGALKPYVTDEPADALTQRQMEMTLDVMAHSLVYWTQDVVRAGLMGEGGRIYAMTSAGSLRIWKSYGAVSAAKSALESHVRQLAVELIPKGITVNALRAGVTDTPALRKIPEHESMIENVLRVHPCGRLTDPEDIAKITVVLAGPGTGWMTGNVINVDGGEILV